MLETIKIVCSVLIGFGALLLIISVIKYIKLLYDVRHEAINIANKNIVIRKPRRYLYAGIFEIAFILFLSIMLLRDVLINKKEDLDGIIAFFVGINIMELLGFVLCLFSTNWKIEIYEEYFVHKDLIGVKHKYKYDEIEIKEFVQCIRGYKNGKYKFTIEMTQDNYYALLDAKEQYFIKNSKFLNDIN